MKRPRLNQRLILEAPLRLPDGGGGVSIQWQEVGRLWAEIRPRSGRERLRGTRETAEVGHTILIRSAPVESVRRPSPECRFRQGPRIFAIRAVVPLDGTGTYLRCDVTEGAFA